MKKKCYFFSDIYESFMRWPLWVYLAQTDIKLRYRRSALGPWWITMSMSIFVGALGIVYSRLLKQDPGVYLPFLATGYLIWIFITTCITESSDVFIQAQGLIKQIKVPYLIHILRCMTRNLMILFHNLLVYVAIALYFKLQVSWLPVLAIPGLILILLNMFWVCLLVSMLGTRYRDIPPVIASLVTVFFFISPITWMPKMIGEASILIQYNPVTYLLDVVRSPLLGQWPLQLSWIILLCTFILGTAMSLAMYKKYKNRIPFWVG